MNDVDSLIRNLIGLREARGWTLGELATRSGVSRATLSRIERRETSPTATNLGFLAAAFGVPMATLFGVEVPEAHPLVRAGEQSVWEDPETGFVRKVLSPAQAGFRGSIIEGFLPARARIAYAAPPLPNLEHHLVLLSGRLVLTHGPDSFSVEAGDCLRFRLVTSNAYEAPGPDPARYILSVIVP